MINKKIIFPAVFIVSGVLLILFLATNIIPKILVTFSEATPASKVSLENSYFIGEKMLAKADDKENCKVNVFVLDALGKGVIGKIVTVEGEGIMTQEKISGKNGLASFEITSKSEGQIELVANIEGIPLQKTIKVTFRNEN